MSKDTMIELKKLVEEVPENNKSGIGFENDSEVTEKTKAF
ncbi:9258_t:CDS:2 [Entrophospora sp. SA101]|nr:9258_t:CDS:2 [Entrophospora sp. SA101]